MEAVARRLTRLIMNLYHRDQQASKQRRETIVMHGRDVHRHSDRTAIGRAAFRSATKNGLSAFPICRQNGACDPRLRWPALRALTVAIFLSAPTLAAAQSTSREDASVLRILQKHCAMCHAQFPSHTMIQHQPPPKGVVLESIDDLRRFRQQVFEQAVRATKMPLGNETSMTQEERAILGRWIQAP